MITSLSYLQAVEQRKQLILYLVNDTEAVEIYRFFLCPSAVCLSAVYPDSESYCMYDGYNIRHGRR